MEAELTIVGATRVDFAVNDGGRHGVVLDPSGSIRAIAFDGGASAEIASIAAPWLIAGTYQVRIEAGRNPARITVSGGTTVHDTVELDFASASWQPVRLARIGFSADSAIVRELQAYYED
jgi:hypothetical protein